MLLLTAVCGMFTSCKEDIDVKDVDKTMGVQMSLGLPVGSMTATVGDFLGSKDVAKYMHVGEDGVVYFLDTFDIGRRFHPIDIKSYVGTTPSADLDIKSKSPFLAAGTHTNDTGSDLAIDVNFTTKVRFKGVNTVVTRDTTRFDVMKIRKAEFSSTIRNINFPALKWEWINKVTMKLGNDFTTSQGNTIIIFDKNRDGGAYTFGKPIPIIIESFQLNLMKDPNANPGPLNVDSCTKDIQMTFELKVPNGATYTVNTNSELQYELGVELLDYESVFGYFRPGADMKDKAKHVIGEEWDAWNDIRKLKLPIINPTIDIEAVTEVGAPLTVHVNYLRATTTSGDTMRYAHFEDKVSYDWPFEDEPRVTATIDEWKTFPQTLKDYIANTTSPISYPQFHNRKQLSRDSKYGEIDKMLLIRPDIIDYDYQIEINPTIRDRYNLQQYYMTDNDTIIMNAIVKLPLEFSKGDGKDDSDPQKTLVGEGVELNYADTLKNVKISEYSLDSLIKNNDIIDTINATNLRMFIYAVNRLPFDVDARFIFLGEQKADNSYDTIPLSAFAKWDINNQLMPIDTLHIPIPTDIGYELNAATGVWTESSKFTPGSATLIIDIDDNKLKELAKIKNIGYNAFAGHNMVDVKVLGESSLKFRIAIAGDIDAVLNLFGKDDDKK